MKQLAVTLVLVPLIAQGAKSDPCGRWATDCKNLQAFRHARNAELEERKPVLTCQLGSPAQTPFRSIEELREKLPKTSPYNQEEFMSCLSQGIRDIKRMQAEDLKVIESELERQGITAISVNEIESILGDPVSPYVQIKQELKTQKHRSVYETNALAGPLTRFENSLRGTVAKPGLPVIRLYEKSALAELAEMGEPQKVLEHLQDVARKGTEPNHGSIPISPNRDRRALTPGVAKFVLVEVLRNKLRENPAEFAAFLNKLNLRSDFRSPLNREVSNPNFITVHYGYTLAAPLPSVEDLEPQTEFDCTSVIQVCQRKAGLSFPAGFRLNSKRLAALGDSAREKAFSEISFYRENYKAEPYKCEAQLQPGDIVAFNGHAFVFAGYGLGEDGKLELQTIEAMGGEIRSFDSFHRELYGKDACEPARFSANGDTRARVIKVGK